MTHLEAMDAWEAEDFLHIDHMADAMDVMQRIVQLKDERNELLLILKEVMDNRPTKDYRTGRAGHWEEWQMDIDTIKTIKEVISRIEGAQ